MTKKKSKYVASPLEASIYRVLKPSKSAVLNRIEEEWVTIMEDSQCAWWAQGEGNDTPQRLLENLVAHAAHKILKMNSTALQAIMGNLELRIQPASTATVIHPSYGSKDFQVIGCTRLEGKVMCNDGSFVTLVVKWVSHPFHQYTPTLG